MTVSSSGLYTLWAPSNDVDRLFRLAGVSGSGGHRGTPLDTYCCNHRRVVLCYTKRRELGESSLRVTGVCEPSVHIAPPCAGSAAWRTRRKAAPYLPWWTKCPAGPLWRKVVRPRQLRSGQCAREVGERVLQHRWMREVEGVAGPYAVAPRRGQCGCLVRRGGPFELAGALAPGAPPPLVLCRPQPTQSRQSVG